MTTISGAATARLTPAPVPYPGDDAAASASPHATRRALKFGEALAKLERHRTGLRASIVAALAARLLFDLDVVSLVRHPAGIVSAAPTIGLALLPYLVVLWFLATRTRDRFGFGMALGIGVLVVTHRIVTLGVQWPLPVDAAWPLAAVAIAHVPLLVTAFHASTVFPPHDGKRPWIVGFATAVVLVGLAWVAPALLALMRR